MITCQYCGEPYNLSVAEHRCSFAAPPPQPQGEGLTAEADARAIIEHLTKAALELAITREGLEWDEAEDKSIEDMVRSTVNAMTGEDSGCLTDDELRSEAIPLVWLTKRLTRLRQQLAEAQRERGKQDGILRELRESLKLTEKISELSEEQLAAAQGLVEKWREESRRCKQIAREGLRQERLVYDGCADELAAALGVPR